jgi:small-conductance mechanosensitive channel
MEYANILAHLKFLAWKYDGISVGSWLAFAIVSWLVFWGLRRLQRTLVRRFASFASATAITFDDLVVNLIRHTNGVFLLIMATYTGSLWLDLGHHMLSTVRVVVLVGSLWQVGLWGRQITDYGIEELMRLHPEEDAGLRTAAGALGFIARVAMWSILLLLILSNLQVNISTLVAGLGVGGIAVALAVQNILGDLFASLSILLDKPFAVGHFIVVDALAGTVEHVGLKTTRVRSLSGEEIVLSNTDLLKSRIHNYKKLFERRVLFGFGVTYDTGYENLAAIPMMVREIIEGLAKTRFDRAHFKEYGDSSLNFEVVYFVLDPDYNIYMDIQQKINLELYQRFERRGIEFAFPTRTLYVRHAGGAQELRPAGSMEDNWADR